MGQLGLLKLGVYLIRFFLLHDGLFYAFELKQRGVLYLVDLDRVAFDFAQFEKGVLCEEYCTFTMARFMRDL